jgi:hypothetical protein
LRPDRQKGAIQSGNGSSRPSAQAFAILGSESKDGFFQVVDITLPFRIGHSFLMTLHILSQPIVVLAALDGPSSLYNDFVRPGRAARVPD